MEIIQSRTAPTSPAPLAERAFEFKSRVLVATCAVLILVSYLVVYLPPSSARELLREDGPVEQATASLFLLASFTFFLTWRLRSHQPTRPTDRPIYILVLAALMFICMGEEISWGQRIFGWETPQKWIEQNAQAETNLHNLSLIEGGVRDPRTQKFLRSLTNANRLFALFWLTFFVAFPLLDRVSAHARDAFRTLGLPVPSPWFGALFLLNQAAFSLGTRQLIAFDIYTTDIFPLDELKEQNYAITYAIAGIVAWRHARLR